MGERETTASRSAARRAGTRPGERGNQLVEFALIAPLFLMLVMGILDGGRLMATYTVLKSAAREAALYSAKYPDEVTDTIKTIAVQEGNGFLAGDRLTVDISGSEWTSGSCPNIRTQGAQTVVLTYQFDFVTRVLPIPNPITIGARASALVQ